MEPPNKRGYSAPTRQLITPNKTRNGLYFVEPLAKGAPQNLQTSEAIARIIGCSPKPDSKVLLLKTTLPYVIEHGKIELMTRVHGTGWHSAHNSDMPARHTGAIVSQLLWK